MDKWILPYIRQYRRLFTLSLLVGTLTVLAGTALMFTSGYLISEAATQPENILMVYVPIVGVRTFGIVRAVLSYVEKLSRHQFILKILSDMRVTLYKIIEPQALSIRSRFQSGDILGLLSDDIEHLQHFYLKTLFPSLVSLVIYTLIIIVTGVFSLPFAISITVLIGLLIFVGPVISLMYTKTINVQLKKGRHQLYNQFTDAIFGMSDWLISGQSSTYIHTFEKKEQSLFKIEKRKHSFINWRDVLNQTVWGIMVVMAVAWANNLTVNEKIPPTFIAAIVLAFLSLLECFFPIAGAVSETTSYQDSLKRLKAIQVGKLKENQVSTELKRLQDPFAIEIQINHLSFSYLPKKSLLTDINLAISQGEKLAILGRSGSGKTTLLNLIQGALKPTQGEVRINELNAFDLFSSEPNLMGVLNQKPYLFNTSVINNIRLGNQSASDEEVYEAARMVQLDEMIRKLPYGYETNMLETGQRFSGGEQQRIALARILLQKTPIVILDEPTVGLDPTTELALLTTIFNTLKGKTIIWVTHHLAGIEKMDRILFLEGGRIAMDGSHQQLLEEEIKYRRLYALDCPLWLVDSIK